ncbi:MAG TPA: hypothetical protein VKU38_08860, partial [Ktedonobacteraceae bacterium]|nr:hypothetical protein [Ktedonobacteraceae bacterium]
MELEQAIQLWGTEWQTLHRGTASAASSRILIKVLLSSSQQAEVGSPTVIHALRRTTAHEKVQYFDEGDDVRDRFDASTASLSTS